MTKYREWEITYDQKPIADRRFDWDAVHQDYDGPEDGRAFSAGSFEEARREIDEHHLDNNPNLINDQ